MFGTIWSYQFDSPEMSAIICAIIGRKQDNSSLSTMSSDPTLVPYADTESFLTIRLLYHLWRVDSAVRAFPRHLVEDEAVKTAKARWTIGLTLEMVCPPPRSLDYSDSCAARTTGIGSGCYSVRGHDRASE